MFELLKDREKHQPISLEVDLANKNALNFYETIGFKVKNTSESKLVMELLWK
jgi:ribosomal protein S18 acetylase RimI-like enzyme